MAANPLVASANSVLGNYIGFSGRAGRPEYWYWVLLVLIVTILLAIVEGAIVAPMLGFEAFAPEAGQPLRLLFSLAIFLPSLVVMVRRLHDINRSGWWVFINLVPIIGLLILIWWLTRPSDPDTKQYGAPVEQ